MEVVYPDADESIKNIIDKHFYDKMDRFANFNVYTGIPENNQVYIDRIKNADAILLGWGIDNDILSQCERLKAISFLGYGAKNFIDFNYTRNHNIAVMNTPGYGDNAVAEHALSLLLSLTKKVVQNHQKVINGIWQITEENIEVRGKTIGLIGLGGIGKRMITLCKALGINVVAWTFNPSKKREEQLGIKLLGLEELLTHSDFISLHLPYTDETEQFLGYQEFSLMKPGALFINTARAELIDNAALVRFLKNGTIKGAGIDVFDEEPIAENNPLLGLNNVILSPHVGFNTREAIKNMVEISINNLLSFSKGKHQNVINFNNV